MEIAGLHLAVAPILSACYSVVKGAMALHQSYKFMPISLLAISNTCTAVRAALEQVNDMLLEQSDKNPSLIKKNKEQFDCILVTCGMILSRLDEHISDLLGVGGSVAPLSAAQSLPFRAKLLALYNESDMHVLHVQIKDSKSALDTMILVLQRFAQSELVPYWTMFNT